MEKSKWIWMPHPGHFICGRDCEFVLNTYVGGYVVSTVGEMWNERSCREIHAEVYNKKWLDENKHLMGDAFDYAYKKEFGYQDIGCDRKYETMVFKSKRSNHKCCPWRINVEKEVDMEGYNCPDRAYAGHMKLCNKWSKGGKNEKRG